MLGGVVTGGGGDDWDMLFTPCGVVNCTGVVSGIGSRSDGAGRVRAAGADFL